MNTLLITLIVYGLTIVFALIVAAVISGVGALVKKLGLDREEIPLDLSVPSSDAAKEEQALVVAIAVAAHARGPRS